MKHNPKRNIRRRDLLHATIAAAGATAAGTLLPEQTPAKPVDMKDKRRARYQPNLIITPLFFKPLLTQRNRYDHINIPF